MVFNLYYYRRAVVITVCTLFYASMTVLAQEAKPKEPNVKLGKIAYEDFAQNPFPQDSTAEAVVLYERGDVKFSLHGGDVHIILDYHKRIKIVKKSGYQYATVEVPFVKSQQGQSELVTDIEGYTYNTENGAVKTEKLRKTGVFTEKVSSNISVQKFTLPNVREGSIIEYHYRLLTPFTINHNPRTWTFQDKIPVAWSEYRIDVLEYFFYKMIIGGYLDLAIREQKPGEQSYRFVVQNAPAFRDEAYITTADDYIAKMDFELASYTIPGMATQSISVSWDDLDKTLLTDAYFGEQYKNTSFLRDAARAITKTNADTVDRMTAACRFISTQMKWDESESFYSYGLKKAFDAKKGDAGDINLLLVALLREMGFEANPVILSTRSHGRIAESFALLKWFNYVVAHVNLNGKDWLLDATDPFLKPGMLPLQCLNGTGRLILPDKQSRFVRLIPAERDIESSAGAFSISSEGEVSGTLKKSYGGYSALSQKRLYAEAGEAKYLTEVKKKKPTWQITKAELSGTQQNEAPFDVTYQLTIPEACQQAGDRLYLKPMLSEAHEYNPFKEPDRAYPVDLGVPIDETYVATFTMPDQYQLDEAPKPSVLDLPNNGGRFTYQVNVNGRQLQIASRLILRKSVYKPSEYSSLREFLSEVVAKQAEQIVLKRSSTVAEKK